MYRSVYYVWTRLDSDNFLFVATERLAEDNFLKTCTELAIFATIMTALVLNNDAGAKDTVLLSAFDFTPGEFLLLVLCALVPVSLEHAQSAQRGLRPWRLDHCVVEPQVPFAFVLVIKAARVHVRIRGTSHLPRISSAVVVMLGSDALSPINDPLVTPSAKTRALAMYACGVATKSEMLTLKVTFQARHRSFRMTCTRRPFYAPLDRLCSSIRRTIGVS